MVNRFKPFRPYIRTRVTIDMPIELHLQLKELAKQQESSVTSLITKTLVKMIVNELYIKGKYPHFT